MLKIISFVLLMTFTNTQETERESLALLMAQSCTGEAGFNSYRTGECGAILHIYKKRSEVIGLSLRDTIMKYSSAVKPLKHRSNRWVLFLNANASEPMYWPKRLNWGKHKEVWKATYAFALDFIDGKVPDPLPRARHFGGSMDHWRAQTNNWCLLETPYRNNFYYIGKCKNK